MPTVIDSSVQTRTYLVDGQPTVTIGTERIVPYRLTITHREMDRAPIPTSITVQLNGYFEGTKLRNTYELAPDQRPAWITELVNDDAPTWWPR
ncbi:hypothetical protein [Kitasatospora sp. NPDC058478]|uniref:hypothetical protein n=1 Tax=unclassified Kitasatospora TaxID=2633591 RepID=UPI0036647C21